MNGASRLASLLLALLVSACASSSRRATTNEAILARVEALGGHYVWETEVFIVALIEEPASDAEVIRLTGLHGVEQIAVDARNLSAATLRALAGIRGLESLVLYRHRLSEPELERLRRIGPEIVLAADDA